MPRRTSAPVSDGLSTWPCVEYSEVTCQCPRKQSGACGLGLPMPNLPAYCRKCRELTTETLTGGFCDRCLATWPNLLIESMG